MFRITEFLKATGVDTVDNFMVVPLEGTNFVRIHGAQDFNLQYNRSSLGILKVTREQLARVSTAMHEQHTKNGMLLTENRHRLREITNTLPYSVSSMNSALYLITGKTRGIHKVKAVSGRTSFEFEVAVVPKGFYTIAFKFLQHSDGAGGIKTPSKWKPSDAQWMIDRLNWIYGMQANVFFGIHEADWVKIDRHFADQIDRDAFFNIIAKRKNNSADLNVFFVGKYVGTSGEAGGTFDPIEETAVVDDNGNGVPVTEGEDAFTVILAHEVGHFLIKMRSEKSGHHDREKVLMSTGYESTKIDKYLVKLIHGL
jgi:hypothetical protein